MARQLRGVECRMTLAVRKMNRTMTGAEDQVMEVEKKKSLMATAYMIRETGMKVLGASSGMRKANNETWWGNKKDQECIKSKG